MNARRWKRYPAYRDSGVEWLGEVPSHWKARRLKHVTEVLVSNVDKHAKEGEAEVRLCNYTDVYYNDRITPDLDFMFATASSSQIDKFTLRADDVIITKDSETAEDIAVPAVVTDDMPGVVCGYHLALLRPNKAKIAGAFLNYMLRADPVSDQFTIGAQGITRHGLTYQKINDVALYLPPLREQRAIAAFLNRETARIDALVAKKEELIRLLEEKRTALISHVVTKGLNPSAAMKDSGVPWLGEIPAHWEIRRLKHISPEITVGIVVQPSQYVSADGVPFLYGGEIREARIDLSNTRRMARETSEALQKSRLSAGDVVVVRVGAPGVAAVVPPDLEGANCASIVIVRGAGSFHSRWLMYAMNSRLGRYQVELVQYGAAQEQFNVSHAVHFAYPVPPLAEQADVADALDIEWQRFESMVSRLRATIDLLREQRQALITAAVTGQIDVREDAFA